MRCRLLQTAPQARAVGLTEIDMLYNTIVTIKKTVLTTRTVINQLMR